MAAESSGKRIVSSAAATIVRLAQGVVAMPMRKDRDKHAADLKARFRAASKWSDGPSRTLRYAGIAVASFVGVGAVYIAAMTNNDAPIESASISIPRNCDEARARGIAPMRRGEPGYHPKLDADGDGIACEPIPRRR